MSRGIDESDGFFRNDSQISKSIITDQSQLPVHVTGLVVQSQEGHRGVNGLPALGTQPHHLEAGLVDLLRELVDGNVTGSTHQYWAGGETFDYRGP